ncbi:MAG: DUF4203 domain-containing protein [Lachnospiraceae bacterium]|nr:DUF4203 domain-containing protein [Lachnospiraceae bacterium]
MDILSDTSPLLLVLALIVAFFIWGAGYKLYKLAVFFLGFLAGYMLCGTAISTFWPAPPVPSMIIQIVVGLAVGAVSFLVVKVGLFVAAACAVFMILSGLLEKLGMPGLIIAFASAVVAGFIATKADKPVIIVITGILGGFAIPMILYRLAGVVSFDTSFLPPEKSIVVLAVEVVLSVAGILIQFVSNREKSNE